MHPDRKIGFAMGILLVGIVAALFFRNEPLMMTEVAPVRRERELNQQLKDRNVAVYLDETADSVSATGQAGDENVPWTLRDLYQELDSRNDGVPVPVGAAGARQLAVTDDEQRQLPGGPRDDFRPVADGGAGGTGMAGLPPLPSVEMTESRVEKTASVPGDDKTFRPLPPLLPTEPAGDNVTETDVAAQAFRPPEKFDEYTVRYGDTLSEISERFLGAQSRYREIYEANRDRMDSPDQLRVGKAIRIPLQ